MLETEVFCFQVRVLAIFRLLKITIEVCTKCANFLRIRNDSTVDSLFKELIVAFLELLCSILKKYVVLCRIFLQRIKEPSVIYIESN